MQKLKILKANLKRLEKVAIAFSGGVDSTFLLYIAIDVLGKENVLVLTATGPFFPMMEQKEAVTLTNELGAKHLLIPVEFLKDPQISSNLPRRCYYCKRKLMATLIETANDEGFNFLLDGANIDDFKDYRPGLQAAKELGVLSPLQEVFLNKKEIRELSRQIGLATWRKPAMACLASRFPYGTSLTDGKLKQVEAGEYLLFSLGFKQIRLRWHEEIARLEVGEEELTKMLEKRQLIISGLKELGFKYITMDLEGYRTGSLNEILAKEG